MVFSQGISAPFARDRDSLAAQCAQSVLAGDWLVPRDMYGCFCRKPPLYYWLSAGALGSAGRELPIEVGSRLVSLSAAVALAVEVLLWTGACLGGQAGWLAFGFLLGSYGFASRATLNLTDMLLSLLLFTAYCLLGPALVEKRSRPRVLVGGIVLGLAVLTKGPVAIVLCLLGGTIWLAMAGRLSGVRLNQLALAIAVALGVAGCWYVPALIAGGREYLGVILSENLGHLLPPAMGGTGQAVQPWYFIVARMANGALPLAPLIPALVVAMAAGEIDRRVGEPLVFQLGLVLAVLALFTIASTKRADYVLPALPGLAILLSGLLTIDSAPGQRWMRLALGFRDAAAGLIAIAVIASMAGVMFLLFHPEGKRLAALIRDPAAATALTQGIGSLGAQCIALAIAATLGAIFVLGALVARKPPVVAAGLVLVSVAVVTIWNGSLRPNLERRQTVREFAIDIAHRIGDAPLYVASQRNNDLSFYSGYAIPVLRAGVPLSFDTRRPLYLFASSRELEQLGAPYRDRAKVVLFSGILTDRAEDQPNLYELDLNGASVKRNNETARYCGT